MEKNSINRNSGINATMMIYFLSLEHPLQWSQQFLSPPIYLARAPPLTTSYTLPVGINYMSSGSPFENLAYIFSREFAIVRRSGCLTWHGACARNRAINTLQRRNEQQEQESCLPEPVENVILTLACQFCSSQFDSLLIFLFP